MRNQRDRLRFQSALEKIHDSDIGQVCERYYQLHDPEQLEKYKKARTGMNLQKHREYCLDLLYQAVQRNYYHYVSRGEWDTKVSNLFDFMKTLEK